MNRLVRNFINWWFFFFSKIEIWTRESWLFWKWSIDDPTWMWIHSNDGLITTLPFKLYIQFNFILLFSANSTLLKTTTRLSPWSPFTFKVTASPTNKEVTVTFSLSAYQSNPCSIAWFASILALDWNRSLLFVLIWNKIFLLPSGDCSVEVFERWASLPTATLSSVSTATDTSISLSSSDVSIGVISPGGDLVRYGIARWNESASIFLWNNKCNLQLQF